MELDKYIDGILNKKDITVLSKAITLIESSKESDRKKAFDLLTILSKQNKNFSHRIGITGTPGVGKSSFIEKFGQILCKQNKKIAVLTIDPSSQKTGGSILGDKTRMINLSNEPNAYIRPTPSTPMTGGLHKSTSDTIILCEAFGIDTILIETVGVGQSEVEIENYVDTVFVLMQPGSGDELQGIKKGILEIGDFFIVTKWDGDLEDKANEALNQLQFAINLNHLMIEKNIKEPFHKISIYKDETFEKFYSILISYYQDNKLSLLKNRVNKQNFLFDRYLISEISDTLKKSKKFQDLKNNSISCIQSTPECFWGEIMALKSRFFRDL